MKDILLDEGYDLEIKDGDFVVEQSDEQHLKLLMESFQGHWKEFPLVGCNLVSGQNGAITRELYRHIQVQLEADGFMVKELSIREDGITVKGDYKNEK